MVVVSLLDYGAGNVRSVRNAVAALGFELRDVRSAEDVRAAEVLLFPGVGSFGNAVDTLEERGLTEALREYVLADRPFFGICLGMQTLFEASEESPGKKGLGVVKGTVTKFDSSVVSVPHIGWNGLMQARDAAPEEAGIVQACQREGELVYFVHSYRAIPSEENKDWVLLTTTHGNEPERPDFVAAVSKGNVFACQFHPEKSGQVGLAVLGAFLERATKGKAAAAVGGQVVPRPVERRPTKLAKRVVACLDVRTNDHGDLVVTKGDQYDVREASEAEGSKGHVRNLGKPVELAGRYYEEGADEVCFLNITSFRQGVIEDMPMLQVLEETSKKVFVPLTVGGGIREYTDPESGKSYSALDVASRYFRAGADKVSLGSDAVYAAEAFLARTKAGETAEQAARGDTSLESISHVYGRQAVVVSVDPRRVYVASPDEAKGHVVVELKSRPGPSGERFAWYQCTVKGGREGRDIDAVTLAKCCEALGAGEILLNCVDMDGQKAGFDLDLVGAVMGAVSIPVVASSGAGAPQHFTEVFRATDVQAALAAGIFHRREVAIEDVKKHLVDESVLVRTMA